MKRRLIRPEPRSGRREGGASLFLPLHYPTRRFWEFMTNSGFIDSAALIVVSVKERSICIRRSLGEWLCSAILYL